MRNAVNSTACAAEIGYRLGAQAGLDAVLVRAVALGHPLGPVERDAVARGAAQVFPLRAADLPRLSGPALGQALKAAEARWIASGFLLDKAALIAELGGPAPDLAP